MILKMTMIRATLWMGGAIAICSAFLGGDVAASEPERGSRPNVLFVSIDDLNDWIGCFGGNPQVKTPNLDRLASDGGLVFTNAYAPATVCCPSRSAILTGKHPHNTGVYGNKNNLKNAPAAKDLVTLPEYFSKHGYHSLSMGKIFHHHQVPTEDGTRKTDKGQWAFDEYHETMGGTVPASGKTPINGLPNLPNEKISYHYHAFDWGPTELNDETEMLDYKTANWAAEQLKTRDFDGKPFFMAVGISKPHLTWYVPQKYFDMYPLDEIVMPKTLATDLNDILDRKGKPFFKPNTSWLRAEQQGRHKEAVQAYLATVTFVDDCIGVLLDGLASSKYADNTIVVLWGDHGWFLGEKQRYGKTMLWQESCRVPLMVKVPGVTHGETPGENIGATQCSGLVNLIDMYPTLVELCGLPSNPALDGRSFAPLLSKPERAWNHPTLTNGCSPGFYRVFDGRYSYISYQKRGSEELYDHNVDPMEWNNLSSDSESESIKARLKAFIPRSEQPKAPE